MSKAHLGKDLYNPTEVDPWLAEPPEGLERADWIRILMKKSFLILQSSGYVELADLLERMTSEDPAKRPTSQEVAAEYSNIVNSLKKIQHC